MGNIIFTCYNKEQRNYFRDCGCKDVVYGVHPKTGKYFWVFIRDEIFNKAYEKWLNRSV